MSKPDSCVLPTLIRTWAQTVRNHMFPVGVAPCWLGHIALPQSLTHAAERQRWGLHAWLTMLSHEILDLTFGTTYGVVNGIERPLSTATFTLPSELKRDQWYHPQLVGTDYFYRVGAITELPHIYFG